MRKIRALFFISNLLLFSPVLYATHNMPAYGTYALGMAGVRTAYIQDAIEQALNPAGAQTIEDRFDFDISLINPYRKYSYTGVGVAGDSIKSSSSLFLAPNLGYRQCINDKITFGFSVYTNGGLNTNYPRNNPAFGQGPLGIDLGQVILAPMISSQLTEDHAVGIAPLIGIQRFKAQGLQNFAGFSINPNDLTNRGYSYSKGIGVRIGWIGQITPLLSVGAAYATKTYMSRFSKYSGLLPQRGKLDFPSMYSVGIKIKAHETTFVAFDIERILYKQVKSFNNSINLLLLGFPLGANNGPAFGWKNVTTYKLGIAHSFLDTLVLRTGISYGNRTYGPEEMEFNILAPDVPKVRISTGFTYQLCERNEFSMGYLRVLSRSLSGPARIPHSPLGVITHKAHENILSAQYTWKF